MNPRLLRLAADLLTLAAREFSNHNSNDYRTPDWFTEVDLDELALLLDASNSENTGLALKEWRSANPEDATSPDDLRHYLTDFTAMRAMAFMLRSFAKQTKAVAS